MRLLFAHPSIVARNNHEGAHKVFKALVAALAAAGHECEVVSVARAAPDLAAWQRLSALPAAGGTVRFELAPASPGDVAFAALVRRRVQRWQPDRVVVENGTLDVRLALLLAGRRLALSVSTTASLPFGPRSAAAPKPWARLPYARVPRIFCPSRYVRDYLHEHAGVDAFVQPVVGYGAPPYPACARFEPTRITMINPTGVKGGAVFASLARRRSDWRFRAQRTYAYVVEGLAELDNVELLPPAASLDDVLRDSSVLLAPSMWGEGWGTVCIDAMLRGIPVLASDDGALPESMLGTGACVPVTPGRTRLRRYRTVEFRSAPFAVEPWAAALDALVSDREAWVARSRASAAAARGFVASLSVSGLADYLAAR